MIRSEPISKTRRWSLGTRSRTNAPRTGRKVATSISVVFAVNMGTPTNED